MHVKRSKTMTLFVSNPTAVDARWHVERVTSNDEERDVGTLSARDFDVGSTFVFSQTSGVLAGPTIPHDSGIVRARPPKGASKYLERLPKKLTIDFRPPLNGRYVETFRLVVEGGKSSTIRLVGEGTYDEEALKEAGW